MMYYASRITIADYIFFWDADMITTKKDKRDNLMYGIHHVHNDGYMPQSPYFFFIV